MSAPATIAVIERIETTSDPPTIVAVYSEFVADYGFDSVAMAHLVNPALLQSPANDWFNHSTWPVEWYQSWTDERFIFHDPIARYALRTNRPFTWAQAYAHGSRFGKEILDKSRDFGFAEGLAIPIHAMEGPPGCVSLGGRRLDLAPIDVGHVEIVSRHCFARLERLHHPIEQELPPTLSKRETEVLHYAAAGKTNWEIGRILAITEETARKYVQSAAKKLGSSNRTHAVSVAIQKNLILP